MRFLIDTNVLINIIEDGFISDDVYAILSDYSNQIYSVAMANSPSTEPLNSHTCFNDTTNTVPSPFFDKTSISPLCNNKIRSTSAIPIPYPCAWFSPR